MDNGYQEYTGNIAVPYESKIKRLVAAITEQAIKDIEWYAKGIFGVSRYDYTSALGFFAKGGGLDYYLTEFGIEDWRYTKLRNEILSRPFIPARPNEIDSPPKTVVFRRPAKRPSVENTCQNPKCRTKFLSIRSGVKWCPDCRAEMGRTTSKEWNRIARREGRKVVGKMVGRTA